MLMRGLLAAAQAIYCASHTSLRLEQRVCINQLHLVLLDGLKSEPFETAQLRLYYLSFFMWIWPCRFCLHPLLILDLNRFLNTLLDDGRKNRGQGN